MLMVGIKIIVDLSLYGLFVGGDVMFFFLFSYLDVFYGFQLMVFRVVFQIFVSYISFRFAWSEIMFLYFRVEWELDYVFIFFRR